MSYNLDVYNTTTGAKLKSCWVDHGCESFVPIIDLQHIYIMYALFELVRLGESSGDRASKMADFDAIFSAILDYTSEHFYLEGELFRVFSVPDQENHLAEHRSFISHFLQTGRTRFSGGQSSLRELAEELKEWLSRHIVQEDRKYIDFLSERIDEVKKWSERIVRENQVYVSQFQLRLYTEITGSRAIEGMVEENLAHTIYHMWKTYDLSIHVPLIDIQHIWFIYLMLRADRAVRIPNRVKRHGELFKLIHRATQYATVHFHTEERFMERFIYPGRSTHKFTHEAFAKSVQKWEHMKTADELGLLIQLAHSMKDWLISHVAVQDKSLLWYFRKLPGSEILEFSKDMIHSGEAMVARGQMNLYNQVMEQVRREKNGKSNGHANGKVNGAVAPVFNRAPV